MLVPHRLAPLIPPRGLLFLLASHTPHLLRHARKGVEPPGSDEIGILGLNATYINQYVKYLADRRLEELGFDPEYKVSNPAKWMATANDTYELVNFFESTNTSYEANAKAVTGKKKA